MEHSKIIIYELKNTNYITAEESLNGGTYLSTFVTFQKH